MTWPGYPFKFSDTHFFFLKEKHLAVSAANPRHVRPIIFSSTSLGCFTLFLLLPPLFFPCHSGCLCTTVTEKKIQAHTHFWTNKQVACSSHSPSLSTPHILHEENECENRFFFTPKTEDKEKTSWVTQHLPESNCDGVTLWRKPNDNFFLSLKETDTVLWKN